MKCGLASAACVLALLSCGSAHAWGSLKTTGSNTHGCLDRSAYAVLAQRPGFNAEVFPKLDALLDHEGVSWTGLWGLQGNGPDADGATFFSQHYFNPYLKPGQQDRAPEAAKTWFVKLAQRQDTAKAAAWSAHFIADMTVPFHVNGMFGAGLRRAFEGHTMPLPIVIKGTVTGNYGPEDDWAREADRYLAASKGAPYLDWFDPWYWDGPKDGFASYVDSSHLMWEFKIRSCPTTARYDELWPGNPKPGWEHVSNAMGDVVAEFIRRVTKRTRDNQSDYVSSPDHALAAGVNVILTLWRASFSGLRVSLTEDPDPAPTRPGDLAGIVVRGRLQNLSGETPEGVEMKLAIRQGSSCKRKEPELVKIGTVAPGGPRYYGYWHVSVPDPKNCQLRIGVIGKLKKTPDLQLDWYDQPITVKLQPAAVVPVPPKPQASKPSLDPCACSFYIGKHPAECSDWMHRRASGTYEEHERACQALEQASAKPSAPADCLGADFGSEKCTAH